MTPLATAIYKHLRATLRTRNSITYGALAERVSRTHPTHHRSPRLHAALTEVTAACRARGLPALPAIVWSATSHRPSSGYYAAAHPRARTERSKQAAWEREHAAVIRDATRFPITL